MDVTGSHAPPRAGRREWLGLAVLALPTMLAMLDLSVLFLALPHLARDLDASATQQLWITDIYGFLIAGFLVTMGTLGDRIGRRRVLLLGAAAFGAASVLAAYSQSAEMLIASRALLGIAGATIMPSTLALIMGMFPHPSDMGKAIGVWASSLTAGVALGPIVGGVMLEWFWWGSVFLIGVPVMLLVLVAGPALLPAFKNPQPGRLDPTSVALSLAAILPFVYGLKEIARSGWHASSVVLIAAGLAFGVIFVVRQSRLEHPLLDLKLFGIRAVSGALLVSFLTAIIQGGSGLLVSQHMQLVKGLSPLETGLWILVPTLVLVVGIFISQRVAQQQRPAHVIAVGVMIAAIGMLMLTQISAATGIGILMVAFVIIYFGISPVGPLVAQLVVPSAPPEKAGSASSLASTAGELGLALGIAVLGSVGMAVYRGQVSVPAEIAGTPAGDAARESLPGALQAAQSLPESVAGGLIASAREAFTSGLNVVAVICVVAFVALAGLVMATLRQLPPMAPPPAPPEGGEGEAAEAAAQPATAS